MSAQVPLVRRNLVADVRRLVASVVGVGLAVMLIVLLDGLWAGVRHQATAYTDRAGGDLYVLQPGVRDLTAGAGSVPLSTVETVKTDPDVSWAAPVDTAYLILQLHGRKVPVYVVGSVPGQQGGAWSMSAGRRPQADDEIALGRTLADRHGIKVGDRLDVMGSSLRVVGSADAKGYMFSYAFVTHDALARLTGTSGTTSFVLVGTPNPAAVAERLRAGGLNVLDRERVGANDLAVAAGIFGAPMRLMVAVGLAAGTLIIALTAYTAIIERRREYGIVKALGGSRRRLVGIAVTQTVTIAALGLVAGWVLAAVGRLLIEAARPQFTVLLTTGGFVRAAAAALLMAVVAAVIPARRLATLEPAVAYGSGR